jgi:hypothetical protein
LSYINGVLNPTIEMAPGALLNYTQINSKKHYWLNTQVWLAIPGIAGYG